MRDCRIVLVKTAMLCAVILIFLITEMENIWVDFEIRRIAMGAVEFYLACVVFLEHLVSVIV